MLLGEPLLKVTNLTKTFGRQQVLNRINFSLNTGEIAILQGCSGEGKSTLVKLIVRQEMADSGNLWFKGQNYSFFNYNQMLGIKKQMAWLMQGCKASFSPYYKVRDELLAPSKFYAKQPVKFLHLKLYNLMDELKLSTLLLNKTINEVSGGEAERLALVRALLCQPSLLIMDEATSGLNNALKVVVFNVLQQLNRQQNLTLFIISHQEVTPFLQNTVHYFLEKGYLNSVK